MKTSKYVHHHGPLTTKSNSKLNWLRASVLGVNDGLVSTSGIVVGVAGATSDIHIIFTAGIAGLIAGAISMASGEYISVSSSRDIENSLLKKEKYQLKHYPTEELEELTHLYEEKGLSSRTARTVAEELSAKDPFAAHIDAEVGIDPDDLTNPMHASLASGAAFVIGAIIPFIAILFFSQSIRISMTFFSVLVALVITGIVSAKISETNILRSTIRIVLGGALAMLVTYSVGRLFNTAVH